MALLLRGSTYLFNLGDPAGGDPAADYDGDGICNGVDLHRLCPSTLISDGHTTGHLVLAPSGSRPIVPSAVGATVCDSTFPSPNDGIAVTSGSGSFSVNFAAPCSFTTFSPVGTSTVIYTCGSLHVLVVSGSTVGEFTIDGITHEVVVNEGGSLTLEDTVDECGELLGVTVIVAEEAARESVIVDGQVLAPGQTVPVGVCGTLLVQADKHTVGSGTHPGSTKVGMVGMQVCVFDKSEGSCAAALGVSWQNYPQIFASGEAVACGTTDSNGSVGIMLEAGDYIVIGQHDPDPEFEGDELYIGVSASNFQRDPDGNPNLTTMRKHLQLLVDANGNRKPGKTTRLTGSELLIIEPEYVLWDETEQLYPFVFETIGEWSVTASVTPPQGFVADYNELSQAVNNDLQALQFIITELGSDLVPTQTTFQVQHNGRRRTVLSEVDI